MTSKKIKFTDINQYVSTFPKKVRDVLEEIRKTIHTAAPDAEETISYNIPTFKMNGKYLIYFAGYKKHVSIYPVQSEGAPFQEELSKYVSGKGTAQFKLDEPIPYDLISQIVKYRLENPVVYTTK